MQQEERAELGAGLDASPVAHQNGGAVLVPVLWVLSHHLLECSAQGLIEALCQARQVAMYTLPEAERGQGPSRSTPIWW